jgi:hypothetical protein
VSAPSAARDDFFAELARATDLTLPCNADERDGTARRARDRRAQHRRTHGMRGLRRSQAIGALAAAALVTAGLAAAAILSRESPSTIGRSADHTVRRPLAVPQVSEIGGSDWS